MYRNNIFMRDSIGHVDPAGGVSIYTCGIKDNYTDASLSVMPVDEYENTH